MADESQQYRLSAIRDLLIDAFNAEELRQLFYFAQTSELQAVPGEFAPGDSLPAMVRKAVRYCDSRFLLGEMLTEVKAANPRAYERYKARLIRSTAEPPAPAPAATSAPGAKAPRALGRIPVWGVVAALVVVVAALAVVLVLVLRGPASEPVTPEPTLTPTQTESPEPTQPAATDTPEPMITPTSTITPTLPPEPSSGKLFKVVYWGADGVTIRSGAGADYSEEGVVYNGALLVVDGGAEIREDVPWWPVHTGGAIGYVAEWVGDTRLIKPFMEIGDAVVVANPMSTGNVALRDENCETLSVLGWGTQLRIVGGPDPHGCDEPGDTIFQEGREWWYVQTETDEKGWVADFSGMEWPGFVKAVLVAPRWYVDWSSP